MTQRLSPTTIAFLTIAPLLWAGNAVVGRMVNQSIPPMTLNFLRWALASALLLPLAWQVLRPGSSLWPHWRRFALLGLFGIGNYNALQYLALQTSTPLNVTLVGSSMPVWMMALGLLVFREPIRGRQLLGVLLSIVGVALVLSRGHWQQLLALRLVPGDIYMLLATISWALYSWLLARTLAPADVRANWAAFLLAQLFFGVLWSGSFAAVEWGLGHRHIAWSPLLLAALAFIAIGPALLAYRFWGVAVQQAGPVIAAFFSNLTPLFAALLSAAFLGEWPQPYHGIAFLLIVGGILIASKRSA